MIKSFAFGSTDIDIIEFASRGCAVLGIRDSGKTYTATALAERLIDAGVPIIAFDPTGVWPYLRVPREGKGGRGFPIVIAGGDSGDLPLTVADAPRYVRAALQEGVSLVIDLFDKRLSKADWKRIMVDCVHVLIYENKEFGLRHVFIEEAAEFIPQRVGRDMGQVYAEMEKLARLGGNSRLGFTLINQRAEEVNKAVLELCDNLFLHRQKGRNSLTALGKWLDIGNVGNAQKIASSLPDLPSGQCWTWLKDGGDPTLIKVPQKQSLHPDRRALMSGDVLTERKAVDVSKFVEGLKSRLAKPTGAAKSASAAKTQNKDVAVVARGQVVIAQSDLTQKLREEFARGSLAGQSKERGELKPVVSALIRDVLSLVVKMDDARERLSRLLVRLESGPTSPVGFARTPSPEDAHAPKRSASRQPAGRSGAADTDTDAAHVDGGVQRVLDAIAWWNALGIEAPSQSRVAFQAEIARKGGTWRTYLGRAKTLGLVTSANSCLRLTEEGEKHARRPDDPPSTDDLRKRILERVGPGPARILTCLLDGYPATLSRAALLSEANYDEGGTFRTYLGRLRTLELVDMPERGIFQASPMMF